MISDIYAQKLKHDERCRSQNQCTRETMEQFLYTYLNTKYGLKSIIVEQINVLMQSVNLFRDKDVDILIFSKILGHKIDEEFRMVLS